VSATITNILLVLAFILVGGFFSASEIALVSLRESRVKALAEESRRGAKVAALFGDPNRFLAAVQFGVTLAGFLSAAFGATTLAGQLTPVLTGWGMPDGVANPTSLIVVTVLISYASIVLGELAPKRLAMQRPEGFALFAAPFLDRIATLVRPITWLLSWSSDLVVRALGADPRTARDTMSEEELRDLVAGHETLGREERRMISEIFRAGERRLYEVMLPRTEVDFLDASTPLFKAVKDVSGKPHSRYPVVRGSHDDVVGFVHVRDLFDPEVSGRSLRVGQIARDVLMLPSTLNLLAALSEMRRQGQHLAIVLDEYGGTDGIVTLEDLVEELIGDIRDEYDVADPQTRTLRGGAFEVDGLLNLNDFADETGITLPEGPYETLAGFLMSALGRVPEGGDTVEALETHFTVLEVAGRRVARVRITPLPATGMRGGEPGSTSPGDADHDEPAREDELVAEQSAEAGGEAAKAAAAPGAQP
jgi:putative hemolysin